MNLESTHINEYLASPVEPDQVASGWNLWVNSDQLSFHEVELPDTPKSKWPSLLPWILEDELLMPVEEMHLVICAVDASRKANVMAIPKNEMFRLQLLIEERADRVRSLVPDVLALPQEEGFTSVATQGDRLIVRSGLYQGFSGCTDFVWQILQLQHRQGELLKIQCFGLQEEQLPDWARPISYFNSSPINWEFAEPLSKANLLQGEFRPRKARSSFDVWIPSLGLAVIAICLLFSFAIVDHVKTGRELIQINQQLSREFQAVFGSSVSIPERTQIEGEQILHERELRYLSVSNSIYPVTEVLDSVLSSCANCGLASVQLDTDSATLVMQSDSPGISRLANLEGYRLTTSEPNEQQQVVIGLQRQVR